MENQGYKRLISYQVIAKYSSNATGVLQAIYSFSKTKTVIELDSINLNPIAVVGNVMSKFNYNLTIGLTKSGNIVANIITKYHHLEKNLIVFLDKNDEVLSAQVGDLWFKPEPFLGYFDLSVNEIIEKAQQWALKEKNISPEIEDYDFDKYMDDVISFNDNSDLIAFYKNWEEEEKHRLAEEARKTEINDMWEKYPRINKPKSRELPLDIDQISKEDRTMLPLVVAYKTRYGVEFILIKENENYSNFIVYKHLRADEIPQEIFVVRGWWEEGHGYRGGHTSQANYKTWNASPNKDASYFYDTSWEGSVSGCYPSMLSF